LELAAAEYLAVRRVLAAGQHAAKLRRIGHADWRLAGSQPSERKRAEQASM
jgi:hypothetical protein